LFWLDYLRREVLICSASLMAGARYVSRGYPRIVERAAELCRYAGTASGGPVAFDRRG